MVRFLGNACPDPSFGPWSDSVLQVLYDAIHAVALTQAGATSLMHEAKVDVVTVPNLSEHLSSAATTAQLSARFAYAAAMKSLNNLLLLGDGESWSRQRIDFAGLPEMVRTFLQVAAGAADIPVTRLLGQSPAGLNATGNSDTRNYYDMIAARQALDLRPQLDRLDALILRSAGLDPAALTYRFRPLWQMSAADKAAVALQKAQATQIYAGLGLWDTATTARLVQSQLVEDGVYPGAAEVFGTGEAAATLDYRPDQPRDPQGRWTEGGGASGQESDPANLSAYEAIAPETIFHQFDLPISPAAHHRERERRRRRRKRGPGGHSFGLEELFGPSEPEKPEISPEHLPSEPNPASSEPVPSPSVSASNPASASPSSAERPSPTSPITASRLFGPSETSSPLDLAQSKQEVMVNLRGIPEKQRATSYQDQVRELLRFEKVPPSSEEGDLNPDGARGNEALEVKYSEGFSSSIYNFESKSYNRFVIYKMIEQAQKYTKFYNGGVIYVTNDAQLATSYTRVFKNAGIANFKFVVIRVDR